MKLFVLILGTNTRNTYPRLITRGQALVQESTTVQALMIVGYNQNEGVHLEAALCQASPAFSLRGAVPGRDCDNFSLKGDQWGHGLGSREKRLHHRVMQGGDPDLILETKYCQTLLGTTNWALVKR